MYNNLDQKGLLSLVDSIAQETKKEHAKTLKDFKDYRSNSIDYINNLIGQINVIVNEPKLKKFTET